MTTIITRKNVVHPQRCVAGVCAIVPRFLQEGSATGLQLPSGPYDFSTCLLQIACQKPLACLLSQRINLTTLDMPVRQTIHAPTLGYCRCFCNDMGVCVCCASYALLPLSMQSYRSSTATLLKSHPTTIARHFSPLDFPDDTS